MSYKQLNINTIIDYLKTIDEMKNIFSSFDDLIILICYRGMFSC